MCVSPASPDGTTLEGSISLTQEASMNRSSTARVAATITLVGGALVLGTTASASAQTTLGCPSGKTAYESSFLIAHGFSPDFLAQIDLNGDGITCAKPLSPQQQEKFCSQFPDGCQQPVILGFADNTRGKGY
jgi:hypothetical protein